VACKALLVLLLFLFVEGVWLLLLLLMLMLLPLMLRTWLGLMPRVLRSVESSIFLIPAVIFCLSGGTPVRAKSCGKKFSFGLVRRRIPWTEASGARSVRWGTASEA